MKRLYENIMQLNEQIHDLHFRLESTAEVEQSPAVQIDFDDDQEVNIKRLLVQLKSAQRRVNELEASTSWRITAFLRAIKRILFRT